MLIRMVYDGHRAGIGRMDAGNRIIMTASGETQPDHQVVDRRMEGM